MRYCNPLIVLVLVLSLAGCGSFDNDYIPFDTRGDRQPVNEDPFPIYNKGHLSVGDFFIEAGNSINAEFGYHGWKPYRVEVEGGKTLDGTWEIHTIWVYHE